jgi:hypothetical protein
MLRSDMLAFLYMGNTMVYNYVPRTVRSMYVATSHFGFGVSLIMVEGMFGPGEKCEGKRA